ncbi:MAG: proprotein convertase P-domain-containing protein, partial [Gammaproteobacteria bacterium]
MNDLEITLISPSANSVLVINNTDGSGNNFCQTVLDDESGGPSIQSVVSSNAPFTGAFIPNAMLSAFAAEHPNGTWKLQAQDFFLLDTGNIRKFTVTVTPAICDAAPLVTDLAITKTDGATSSIPAASITYTITASNAGPSAVTGASVADTFPASLTGCSSTCVASAGSACTAGPVAGNIGDSVNLLSGGTATYAATCTIASGASGTLTNTATITASLGVTDSTPANNSATDTNSITPTADLAITKTDGATSSTPGNNITYTIVASNAGPSAVTGASV